MVRGDMPSGHRLAQAVHAAGESGPATSGTYAVVLQVTSEAELLALDERLVYHHIPHVLIREPDAPYCGAATALGVHPMRRSNVSKYMKGMKLCT